MRQSTLDREHILLIFGSSVVLIWFFTITMFQNESSSPLQGQSVFYFGLGGGFLIFSLLSSRFDDLKLRSFFDSTATSVLCIVPVVVAVQGAVSQVLICFAMCMGGIALAWTSVRWFQIFCCFRFRDAGNMVLLSFAMAALVRLLFVLIPPAYDLVVIAVLVVLPPISLIISRRPLSDASGDESDWNVLRDSARSLSIARYIPYMVELLICALVLGLFKNYTAESQNLTVAQVVNHVLRFVVPLLIYLWFNLPSESRRVYRSAQVVMLVMIFCLLAVSLLGGAVASGIIAMALLSLARNVVLVVIYLMALKITFDTKVHPFRMLGIFRSVFETSLGVGILLNGLLGLEDLWESASANIVFLVAGTVFLLVVDRLIIFMRDQNGGPRIPGPDVIDSRCRDIAATHDLTDRETEVMRYICKGFSKGYIAEKLGVSENTVRWHSKNLYEKLGIHSKQEMLEMIGLDSSEDPSHGMED